MDTIGASGPDYLLRLLPNKEASEGEPIVLMSPECHDNVMPRSRRLDGMQVNFEIERRFLVRGNEWRHIETSRTVIRQAYLALRSKASVRVRISNNNTATL